MAPKFKTSCPHNLVSELDEDLVADDACSFAAAEEFGVVMARATDFSADLYRRECRRSLVTGGHIPADRNGLKFCMREGKITTPEEEKIIAALGYLHPG